MKSNRAVISIALLFLMFAVASSITVWRDVSSPVKIGMFALGFGAGVAAGTIMARRRHQT